jgi:hypothetical protein
MRIAILFFLVTCGCAESTHLTKPDLTDAAYARDSRECRQQTEDEALFYNCMRGKGYTVETTRKLNFRVPRF